MEKRSLMRPGTASYRAFAGRPTSPCRRSRAQGATTTAWAVWQTRTGTPAEGERGNPPGPGMMATTKVVSNSR
jgi:hypothetical protein